MDFEPHETQRLVARVRTGSREANEEFLRMHLEDLERLERARLRLRHELASGAGP